MKQKVSPEIETAIDKVRNKQAGEGTRLGMLVADALTLIVAAVEKRLDCIERSVHCDSCAAGSYKPTLAECHEHGPDCANVQVKLAARVPAAVAAKPEPWVPAVGDVIQTRFSDGPQTVTRVVGDDLYYRRQTDRNDTWTEARHATLVSRPAEAPAPEPCSCGGACNAGDRFCLCDRTCPRCAPNKQQGLSDLLDKAVAERDAAVAELEITEALNADVMKERDAALARVAELESDALRLVDVDRGRMTRMAAAEELLRTIRPAIACGTSGTEARRKIDAFLGQGKEVTP